MGGYFGEGDLGQKWHSLHELGSGPSLLFLPPKAPKMTSSGPNPGSRAQNLGLGQMRSFLAVLEGFTPNVTTSGPNPWSCNKP